MLDKMQKHQQIIQFVLVALLILTMPYYIAKHYPVLISFLIFLSLFLNKTFKFKELSEEKSLVLLFSFILMIYLSFLWSEAEHPFSGNYKVNFDGFSSYFFVIPGIYFSKLSKEQLKKLFYFLIIAPLIYVVFYYTNHFNITEFYSTHYFPDTGSKHLYPDLFANIFILFATLFLYILLLQSFIKKEYKKVVLLGVIFLFYSGSLFIDDLTSSRLIIVALLISIFLITIFTLPKKLKVFFVLFMLIGSGLYVSSSESFKTGINELYTAYSKNSFEGSWGLRLNLVKYGFNMYLENPIIGRGTADIIEQMREIRKNNIEDFAENIVHFHNNHLLFMVQVGIVGYSLFLLFIYTLFRVKIEDKEVFLLKQSTIVVIMFLMIGEHYFQWISPATYFAALFAMFLLYHKKELQASS